jgi:ribonuclease T1
MSRRSPGPTALVGVLLVLALIAALRLADEPGPTTAAPSAGASATTAVASTGRTAPPGMASVDLGALPPEAAAVIDLIDAGGPFPFAQDGATFENREGLLPTRPRGYYREYTVPTPGSEDRGARRVVTDRDGEMYWTADHYDSFAWIAR